MRTDTSSVDLVGDELVVNVARAAVLAALTGAFAYVAFPNPLSPTEITLQVLGVFLAGILLGPLWGGVSMVVYLAAGALGAPVFLGGSGGVGALFGATGGYLWSYPPAAVAIGAITHGSLELRDPGTVSLVRIVGALAVGTAIIYAMGIAGFVVVLGMGFQEAFLTGAAAFLPVEILKGAAAVGIVRSDDLAAG